MISAEKRYRSATAIVIIIICSFFLGRHFPVPPPDNGNCPDPIKKRVSEANENWLRGVGRRNNLEVARPLDEADQWNFKMETSFHDFFYPTFDCPHTVERVGRPGYGGKWICGFRQIEDYSSNSPCVVYSYGMRRDMSFEKEILERTRCSVFIFDPNLNITQLELIPKYPARVFAEKIGLGVGDSDTKLRSLKSQLQQNGHQFLEILSLDIEGAESEVLNSFTEQFPLGLPFGQLVVELHLDDAPYPQFYPKYRKLMNNIENMGLRPFRNEINLLGLKRTESCNPIYTEYSFINIKLNHHLLHSSLE